MTMELTRQTGVAVNQRPVIYQALPRLFGNTCESRVFNGSIEENGCGKFSDFSDRALSELCKFGITHLWLTGVLEQASGTGYPGRAAAPADILKLSVCLSLSRFFVFHSCLLVAVSSFPDLLSRLSYTLPFLSSFLFSYFACVVALLSFFTSDRPVGSPYSILYSHSLCSSFL